MVPVRDLRDWNLWTLPPVALSLGLVEERIESVISYHALCHEVTGSKEWLALLLMSGFKMVCFQHARAGRRASMAQQIFRVRLLRAVGRPSATRRKHHLFLDLDLESTAWNAVICILGNDG